MGTYFYQSANGYCYNSDSVFLYAFAKEFSIRGNILDIGCGVGIIGALLARDFNVKLYALEKQKSMFEYAKKNYKINGLQADIENCSLQNYKNKALFDFIISNPPFYKVDKNQSPNISKNIARYEHHLPLSVLIEKSVKMLKQRGYLIFCYDAWQSDDVLAELKKAKLQPEFVKFVHPKANKEAKIVMIAARKASKAKCKILPPLIVFDNKGNYTKEAKNAFKAANTYSIKAEFD